MRVSVGRFLILFSIAFSLITPVKASDERLSVVATVGMIGDIVSVIVEDRADVKTLMGAGIDPHSYRQTRSDVALLTRADVIFHNGLHLEAQLDDLLHKLESRTKVVAYADGVDAAQLSEAEGFSGRYDPHIWMDPLLWASGLDAIAVALGEADPANKEFYAANALAYKAQVLELHERVDTVMGKVPASQRVLVTAHDAFGYFGKAYDIEVVGLQGLSTESEAGLKRVRDVVDLLVERDVKAVFVETSVSQRNIEALIEGAAARGHTVSVGGSLFSDAMGEAGTIEGTYLGMIEHNSTTIARALGGGSF